MMALPVRNRDRALRTWDPISEMERTARRMSQLFDQAPELFEAPEDAFSPLADLEETDDAYVLEIELPGVKKNDIDDEGIEASLDNGVLTLRVPKEESEQRRTRNIEIR